MSVSIGVQLERDNALQDAYAHCLEYGDEIKIAMLGEPDITRDKYNSIKYRTISSGDNVTFHAFPIVFQPTRLQIEKAGLREDVEVIVTISLKELTAAGFTYNDIDMIRTVVKVRNERYVVRDKVQDSQFADVFLYVNIGLKKL